MGNDPERIVKEMAIRMPVAIALLLFAGLLMAGIICLADKWI